MKTFGPRLADAMNTHWSHAWEKSVFGVLFINLSYEEEAAADLHGSDNLLHQTYE